MFRKKDCLGRKEGKVVGEKGCRVTTTKVSSIKP